MATKIQVRRDITANWEGAGSATILSAGEIGLNTTTGNFKIGDGTRTFAQLTYQFPILTGSAGTVADGTTLVVDQTNDRVGIGTATPAQKLDVVGTAAISGNTTIGGTLSAGATTLSGDLAVNAATNADITTTTSTATVFNTNATTLNIGGAATTVGIGAATGTTTINNATTAIAGAATVGGTLAVTGNTTLTGNLAVNGADITTTATGTATVFNTNATTLNVGQAATTVSIGATTGTATIRNATTAITGAATVGGTLEVTGALTATGGINSVIFIGAPSYAADPSSANVLSRKSYVDSLSYSTNHTAVGTITSGTTTVALTSSNFSIGVTKTWYWVVSKSVATNPTINYGFSLTASSGQIYQVGFYGTDKNFVSTPTVLEINSIVVSDVGTKTYVIGINGPSYPYAGQTGTVYAYLCIKRIL